MAALFRLTSSISAAVRMCGVVLRSWTNRPNHRPARWGVAWYVCGEYLYRAAVS